MELADIRLARLKIGPDSNVCTAFKVQRTGLPNGFSLIVTAGHSIEQGLLIKNKRNGGFELTDHRARYSRFAPTFFCYSTKIPFYDDGIAFGDFRTTQPDFAVGIAFDGHPDFHMTPLELSQHDTRDVVEKHKVDMLSYPNGCAMCTPSKGYMDGILNRNQVLVKPSTSYENISFGSSGGPVIDPRTGHVVGILVAIEADREHYSATTFMSRPAVKKVVFQSIPDVRQALDETFKMFDDPQKIDAHLSLYR